MTTSTKDTLSAELLYIGGIGFMFEVNQSLKYNLISPDVLAFFDGIPESEEITTDCAFPFVKPNTNISHSLFKLTGYEWVVCSDGVFRKCPQIKIKCDVKYESIISSAEFYIDPLLTGEKIVGIISL